jgi:signal transduction histidine kinase
MTLMLILPALFAAGRLNDLRDMAVEERGKHAAAALAVGRLGAALAEFDRYERSYVALGDRDLRPAVQRSLEDLHKEVQLLRDAGYQAAAGPLAGVVGVLDATAQGVDRLVGRGQLREATAAFAAIEPQMESAHRRIAEAAEAIDQRAAADFARAESISSAARASTLVATVICLLIALAVGLWTTGALTSPIRKLASAMAGVADGTFHAPADLPYDRWDEIGHLATSFRTMALRLAELDRMKTEFVGIASHELKAPINVIKGYAELIEEELAGEVTGHQRQILHAIADQTHVMARLVSRLMDLSRLEAGNYRMELDEIRVENLLVEVARSWELVATQKGIAFQISIENSALTPIVLDVDLIRDEVLGNLLSNAMKFTPAGGEVWLTARGGPGTITIEVSDTGPGIPAEHWPHVFAKYYQVERSRKIGAGLGLAIAREIVEAHGGTIELMDRPRRGATFRIVLPLRPQAQRRQIAAVETLPPPDPSSRTAGPASLN